MAIIQIRIQSLAQLFDALDPAPMHERGLDRDVAGHIRSHALTSRSKEPLRLCIHFPEALRTHATDVTSAIHAHFDRTHTRGERDFRRRIRIGGVSLAIALGILAGSVWLRIQLSTFGGRALVQGLGEGLLIFGWVAMWRPVEILLFEHWESHLDHGVLERLATIPVAFVFEPDGTPES